MNAPRHVLVAEHDPAVAELQCRYLDRAGFAVTVITEAAALPPVPAPFDAVVLDATMPGFDAEAYARASTVPSVLLRGRSDGGTGLVRPFAPRELVARVCAVLAPRAAAAAAAAAHTLGALVLDPVTRTATVRNTPIALTGTEFELLAYLVAHPGRVHSRAHLLDALWPAGNRAGVRTVDVHVAQIRAKLGSASPVRTIRGVGYVAGQAP